MKEVMLNHYIEELNTQSQWPTQWHQTGFFYQFVDTKGIQRQIYINQAKSDKPCLLLIHGFPTSSYDWHALWPSLTQHFNLLTLDLIGYGLSDKPSDIDYSFALQADIIEAVLDYLGIQHFHILAHDYGDTVAQELLARHGDTGLDSGFSIDSTILLNGGLFPETTQPILIQRLLMGSFGFVIAKLFSFKKFTQNFAYICYQPIPEAELAIHWQLITKNQGIKVIHKIIQYIRERKLHRERWVSALQQYEMPLRFINGICDPISGQDTLIRFEQLIEQADTIALVETGHYPQLEKPQAVLQHCTHFWLQHKIIA
ncbi:alpha/beta fold hydrolase [Shewanella sp. OMA3-2]|uniref:alpha/beta fold hydrolase n=1 Tax=Shewanella sp. OMA3-2 TaxID=2908650 RepID=UPI001F2405BD|nr:alpha/beta hydrolase [Shewanella sp. OMA3-2]UJF21243.1 alpha/beta hydrolase [Shewanella sp. OMA3-2]